MRGEDGLRGESGRVAQRVRALLAERDEASPGVELFDEGDDDREVDDGRGRDDGREVDDVDWGERAARDRPVGRPGPWRRVVARVPVRVDPGRRAAAGIGIAVLLAAVLTGFWLVSSRPDPMPVADTGQPTAPPLVASPSPGATGARSSGTAPAASSAASVEVVVDVAGKVHRPGLYRLPPGSRVDDALRAAGGALRGVDLSSLNLAAKLVDGQQIAVGRPGAAAPAGPAGSPGSVGGTGGVGAGPAGAGQPVNLNTATLEQLESLPGIGPALGQRILDYRTEHGSFASIDQLDDVSGIGPAIFARLKPLVTV